MPSLATQYKCSASLEALQAPSLEAPPGSLLRLSVSDEPLCRKSGHLHLGWFSIGGQGGGDQGDQGGQGNQSGQGGGTMKIFLLLVISSLVTIVPGDGGKGPFSFLALPGMWFYP